MCMSAPVILARMKPFTVIVLGMPLKHAHDLLPMGFIQATFVKMLHLVKRKVCFPSPVIVKSIRTAIVLVNLCNHATRPGAFSPYLVQFFKVIICLCNHVLAQIQVM